MGLRFGENILYYMVVTFSITYLDHIGVNTTRILTLLFFAHILHVLIIPLVGFLTDRIGRKPVYILGAVTTMIWPFLAFPMFNIRSTEMIDRKSVVSGKSVAVRVYLGGRVDIKKKKKNK